jgi:hypothetical protein
MERFVLDGGYEYDEDGEPTVVVANDGDVRYEWNPDDVFGADWKDTDELIEAVCQAANGGGDVIQINDGSDAYWFANSALAKIIE